MERLNYLIRQNTWAIILSAIIFSFIFPSFGHFFKPHLNTLLMILMFLSCLDLQLKEILSSLTDFKEMALFLLIVHIVSPLIIFLLRDYFSPEIFLGLIIASTIPAGRSAVFLSNIYGGIPVKALVITSISNTLSPITVPFFVWLFAHTTIKIDTATMSKTIIFMVIIPLVFAYLFGKTKPGKKLNLYSPAISTFILFLIITGIISPIKDIVTQNPGLTVFLTFLSSGLVIIDFSLGYLLKKTYPEKITYALSSSYKNYTLATLLSLSMFTPMVALPALAYTITNNLLLVPLQFFLKPQHR